MFGRETALAILEAETIAVTEQEREAYREFCYELGIRHANGQPIAGMEFCLAVVIEKYEKLLSEMQAQPQST